MDKGKRGLRKKISRRRNRNEDKHNVAKNKRAKIKVERKQLRR